VATCHGFMRSANARKLEKRQLEIRQPAKRQLEIRQLEKRQLENCLSCIPCYEDLMSLEKLRLAAELEELASEEEVTLEDVVADAVAEPLAEGLVEMAIEEEIMSIAGANNITLENIEDLVEDLIDADNSTLEALETLDLEDLEDLIDTEERRKRNIAAVKEAFKRAAGQTTNVAEMINMVKKEVGEDVYARSVPKGVEKRLRFRRR